MSLDLVRVLIEIVVFLFAISVHESAHAWTASRFGDPTARLLGRVSLNPIRHIDPIGTVLLPAMAMIYHFPVIGWAKPTPVDPRNFGRQYVLADVMTSVAGPISNLMVATGAVLGLIAISLSSLDGRNAMVLAVSGFAGQIPQQSPLVPLAVLLYEAIMINVLLAVFNLIPIPPLDGSHVLRHALSEPARRIYDNIGIFGLLLFFLVGGRVIRVLMSPIIALFDRLLMAFA